MIRFMINAFLFLVGAFLLIVAVLLLVVFLKGIQRLLEIHVPFQKGFYAKDDEIYRVRMFEREIRPYVPMIKDIRGSFTEPLDDTRFFPTVHEAKDRLEREKAAENAYDPHVG